MSLFKTFLKPSESVMASVATVGLVVAAYQYSLPSVAEVQATDAHDGNVTTSRKKAMFTAVGVASGMFLLTHDVNTFTAGGITLIALDWSYRHANSVHPGTGKLVPHTAMNTALDQGYVMPSTADAGYREQPTQGYYTGY